MLGIGTIVVKHNYKRGIVSLFNTRLNLDNHK